MFFPKRFGLNSQIPAGFRRFGHGPPGGENHPSAETCSSKQLILHTTSKNLQKGTKKELDSLVKLLLSLVSNATGGAAGWRWVQGEPWGVGYKKWRNFGGTKPPLKPCFAENRRDFVSFLSAGRMDPSPAPAGCHH